MDSSEIPFVPGFCRLQTKRRRLKMELCSSNGTSGKALHGRRWLYRSKGCERCHVYSIYQSVQNWKRNWLLKNVGYIRWVLIFLQGSWNDTWRTWLLLRDLRIPIKRCWVNFSWISLSFWSTSLEVCAFQLIFDPFSPFNR